MTPARPVAVVLPADALARWSRSRLFLSLQPRQIPPALTNQPHLLSLPPFPLRAMSEIRRKLVIVVSAASGQSRERMGVDRFVPGSQGDGACGKTCLLIVFSKGTFPEVCCHPALPSLVLVVRTPLSLLGCAARGPARPTRYDLHNALFKASWGGTGAAGLQSSDRWLTCVDTAPGVRPDRV